MKFLLTNDDGISAPGLAALEQIANELGEVVVVAPDRHLSGCSHQVTAHQPLVLSEAENSRHMVDGTPADCVRLGLAEVAPDVDWVLAGINDGANLGVDVFMSGTVAAAREAHWLGRPAVAISQYRINNRPLNWERAKTWVRTVLNDLLSRSGKATAFWNVNLPDLESDAIEPEIVVCNLDPSPLQVKYQQEGGAYRYNGSYHERERKPNFDVDVCFGGRIAVTELRSDRAS